jgi:arylsulfatase A-like enzyme
VSSKGGSYYEFAVDQVVFDTKEEAAAAKKVALADLAAKIGKDNLVYQDAKAAQPKLTQTGYDSKEIMHRFHKIAIDYLTEHVKAANPITPKGENKDKNQPFFMYLSFRAPHRPSSHNLTFDENDPMEFYPHASIGKPGEQILLFDQYIGNVMKTLHDLEVADNTLVFFTSDNGPDQGNCNTIKTIYFI